MHFIGRLSAVIGTLGATLAMAVAPTAASASPVLYHFTDDQHGTNRVESAATLTLTDQVIGGLGSGVLFRLQATLTDPVFGPGSKLSDLAFNGPNGVFDNFAAAAYAAYRGDVLIDSMSYTAGDGAHVGGIRFNWSDAGGAWDTAGASPFSNGKTSAWFIGGTTVADFSAAGFQNPFGALHVNALANGSSIWLLDGNPPVAAVPEPQTAALALTGLALAAWSLRRRPSAIARWSNAG